MKSSIASRLGLRTGNTRHTKAISNQSSHTYLGMYILHSRLDLARRNISVRSPFRRYTSVTSEADEPYEARPLNLMWLQNPNLGEV